MRETTTQNYLAMISLIILLGSGTCHVTIFGLLQNGGRTTTIVEKAVWLTKRGNMKHLILGIILTGCGQSFQAQLFSETYDAGSILDAKTTHDSTVGIDSIVHDVIQPIDSGGSISQNLLCCRREDDRACEQCAEFTGEGTCTVEGMQCIFHGSGFVDWHICRNERWEWGEPFGCK